MQHQETARTEVSPPVSSNPSHDIGKDYETPAPLPITSFSALKDRIRQHYELASDYYYSLWYVSQHRRFVIQLSSRGEHIHHGYFLHPEDTKEVAQSRLIDLLLQISELRAGSKVLDVGCGIGGTTRYLAKNLACTVTGITISGQQVNIARELTAKEVASEQKSVEIDDFANIGDGKVRYLELDAEEMGEFFTKEPERFSFDCVWISEAMSHLPDKELFFRNAEALLNPGGKLVVADWFKAEDLTEAQVSADIKPIDGETIPKPESAALLTNV